MDAKAEINKLFHNLQDSARGFASLGLQVGSRALDYTAGTLTSLKAELEKTATRLAPKNGGAEQDAPTAEQK
ncbi:MAG: hypothetical protein HY698_17180 [Deltaproteobacteria bacterium]|nr:hypothetical protein [Deltaproteobacteria bacterium]